MVFGGLCALEGLSLAAGSLAGVLLVVPGAALAMAAYLKRREERARTHAQPSARRPCAAGSTPDPSFAHSRWRVWRSH